MARLNHKGEYWSHLDQVQIIRDATGSPGNTTTNALASVGGVTIDVVSATNFTDGDLVRIGLRDLLEINQIEGAPATTMPLRFPLIYAHASGSVFVEQAGADVGHISDDGVSITFSGDHNVVNAATKRLATAYLTGHAEIQAEFAVLGFAEENLALAVGQSEADVGGSGTTAAPTTIAITADDFNEDNDLSWRFSGARKDGSTVLVDLMATEMDFSAVTFQLQRGSPSPFPMRARATSAVRVSHFI